MKLRPRRVCVLDCSDGRSGWHVVSGTAAAGMDRADGLTASLAGGIPPKATVWRRCRNSCCEGRVEVQACEGHGSTAMLSQIMGKYLLTSAANNDTALWSRPPQWSRILLSANLPPWAPWEALTVGARRLLGPARSGSVDERRSEGHVLRGHLGPPLGDHLRAARSPDLGLL